LVSIVKRKAIGLVLILLIGALVFVPQSEGATSQDGITVGLPYYWGAEFFSVNQGDTAFSAITIDADPDKIGTVIEFIPQPEGEVGDSWNQSFEYPWLCRDIADPYGSELEIGVPYSIQPYHRAWNYTIPSEQSVVYLVVTPHMDAPLYSFKSLYCAWAIYHEPTTWMQVNSFGGSSIGFWEVLDSITPDIAFQNVDTEQKNITIGGYADYTFEIKNDGNEMFNVIIETILEPQLDGIPDWEKEWRAEIGRYTTPGDSESFELLIAETEVWWRNAYTGYALNQTGMFIWRRVLENEAVGFVLRVHAPSNATPDDSVTTTLNAKILESSGDRSFASWTAGNELNESRDSTGIVEESLKDFLGAWWIYIIAFSVAFIAIAGIALYISSKRYKREFCKNAKTSQEKQWCNEK